jgi:hypothetical protein
MRDLGYGRVSRCGSGGLRVFRVAVSSAPGQVACLYSGTDYKIWNRDFAQGAWGPEGTLATIAI